MSIKEGDKIPQGALIRMTSEGPQPISTDDLFAGKKVVLFAVPGAFTPLCSAKHLPGFIDHADEILAKGVDTIACMAVNDIFVMDAWGKDQNAGDKVLMLADGAGVFASALGLELDLAKMGLGLRSKRFAMIVDDGVVTKLGVDEKGFEHSKAEAILESL